MPRCDLMTKELMGPAMNVGNFFIREGSDGDGKTVEYKNIWIESKCIEKHRIIIFINGRMDLRREDELQGTMREYLGNSNHNTIWS